MKQVPEGNKGLAKLPKSVRNKMGYMNKGGDVPEGYHKMPDGSIMKDSEHQNKYYHGGMATKNAKGPNDLRECGMVLSVKDNRK